MGRARPRREGPDRVADPQALLHGDRRAAQDAPVRDPRRAAAGTRRDLRRRRRCRSASTTRPGRRRRAARPASGGPSGRRAASSRSSARARARRSSRPASPVTVRYEATGTQDRAAADRQVHVQARTHRHRHQRRDGQDARDHDRAVRAVPLRARRDAGVVASRSARSAGDRGRTYALEKIGRLGQARTRVQLRGVRVDRRPGVRGHRRTRSRAGSPRSTRRRGSSPRTAASRSRRTTRPRPVASPRTTRTSSAAARCRTCAASVTRATTSAARTRTRTGRCRTRRPRCRAGCSEAGYNVGTIKKISYLSPRGVSGRVLGVKDATHGGVLVDGDARRRAAVRQHVPVDPRAEVEPARARTSAAGSGCATTRSAASPGSPTGAERAWKDLAGTVRGREQSFANGRLDLRRGVEEGVLRPEDVPRAVRRRARSGDRSRSADGRRRVDHRRQARDVRERATSTCRRKYGARVVTGAILAKYVKSGGPGEVGHADERRAVGAERRTVDALREGAHLLVVEARRTCRSTARSSSAT